MYVNFKMGIYTFLWIVNCFGLLPFQPVICRISFAPAVELPLGIAVGIQVQTPNVTYQAYLGIPYAKPPLGSRRFEPPEPYDRRWIGERYFTKYRNNCIGLNHLDRIFQAQSGPDQKYKISGSEDCLYLNIHRQVNLATPVPVIFFIHGGFFSYSDPGRYGPDYLVKENIVYVNFAYRVGPFGFFTTGTEQCSGNMGLKDVIQALNWVKLNIWRFGGNTNKITMAGIDAGAASAHLLYFARISDTLFNNAISYSGTAFSPWAFTKINTVVQRSQALATKFRCPTLRSGDLLRCMKGQIAVEIVKAIASWKTFYYYPASRFTPVDDSTFEHGVFLNNPHAMAIEHKGKSNNWMTGYTVHDGVYHLAEFVTGAQLPAIIHDQSSDIFPYLLFSNVNCQIIAVEARRDGISYYTSKLLEFVTDHNYRFPVLFSASTMSERSAGKTFAYLYDHRPEFSVAQALTNTPWEKHFFYLKASHGDDVANIFNGQYGGPSRYRGDPKVQTTLLQVLLSFSATGEPPSTLNWGTFDNADPKYYNVVHSTQEFSYASARRPPNILKFDSYLEDPNCQL